MNTYKNRICCIFIYGSFYRTAIYQNMGRELSCDFYLGNKISGEIKELDCSKLNGFKKYLTNIWLFRRYYWQKGAFPLIFNHYKKYIITGDPSCISNWVILVFARILNKQTYLWTHGWYGKETLMQKYIKKAFFGLSHHIFLYGEYAKELMIRNGFSPFKLSCIYNSLDYDLQVGLRSRLSPSKTFRNHFNNDNYNIIFIGRLTDSKKIDLLIRALAHLGTQSFKSNLTIIGYGEALEYLKRLSNECRLERNIWFYGECYDEVILSQLIYDADLCVSPGNVGLTAMHAMVYGTPVITHNDFRYQMPEFEAIQDGITGTFFENGSYISLSEKLREWLSNSFDRDWIREKCFEIIDTRYNPNNQMKILRSRLLE